MSGAAATAGRDGLSCGAVKVSALAINHCARGIRGETGHPATDVPLRYTTMSELRVRHAIASDRWVGVMSGGGGGAALLTTTRRLHIAQTAHPPTKHTYCTHIRRDGRDI